MPVSEKTILEPDPRTPGVPLRKSTLAVLALLLMTVGLLSSLLLSAGSNPKTASPAIARDLTELRRTGSEQVLRDEEAEAARSAKVRQAPASAARAPASPTPSLPPLPDSVRREDNSSALFDRKPPVRPAAAASAAQRDLELEAQTRMGKALVADYDAPRPDARTDTRSTGAAAATAGAGQASAPPAPAQAPSAAVANQIDAIARQLRAGQAGGPAAPRTREDWLREYARDGAPQRLLVGYQAPTRLVLRQGKVIPAVLGRQINSDLPGRITATVSANVYDADGRLLIPMGATLVGRYDAGVQVGQSRLLFAFERLVLPNGYSFELPGAAGTDLAGAAGMTGDVDNHFLKMFGTSVLIAVLADRTRQPAAVTQLGTSGPTTAAGQVLSDVSRTVLERNRVIPPTITVAQGTRINVEVAADMVFPAAYPLP
ncbi:MAG TPA: TrbI/VirB10 family protein [Ramlibacter sp.]|jgi:type IV secretion system protein VirB10|nr:TrbI/VirB10 family protein [Ramlibacter sp.]